MKTAQRGKYAFDDFKTFLNVSRKIRKKGHKNYFRNEKKHTADMKQELNPR